MKAVKLVIASYGGTLPPNEIVRIAQHVRKGEGRKEGRGLSLSDKGSAILHRCMSCLLPGVLNIVNNL
jgi:hypothetical protein